MSKYIPAEKLIAEIERLKGLLTHGACAAQIEMETNCKDEAYNEVLSFIAYLQQEQPEYVRKDAVVSIIKDYLENWLDSYRIERLIDKIEEL